jgi:hypothetical protein
MRIYITIVLTLVTLRFLIIFVQDFINVESTSEKVIASFICALSSILAIIFTWMI